MPFLRRVGRPGLVGMAARTAVVAGTATAVSGAVARRQQNRADEQNDQQQQAPATESQTPAPAAAHDTITQLQQLADLHGQGLLTDAEFAAAKAKVLG